ncbi:MAG: LysM peptidoglycan-binding domain-containing protein [Deltaproteobacteria bacterium]|nr:LysM peptidoglycan-binding domain-containing protein [Deltaproteobacteria bacterium]
MPITNKTCTTYTVKPGDNLWKIAKERVTGDNPEGLTTPTPETIANAVEELKQLNQMGNSSLLKPGQLLLFAPCVEE